MPEDRSRVIINQVRLRYGANAGAEWNSFFLRYFEIAAEKGDFLGHECLTHLLDSGHLAFELRNGMAGPTKFIERTIRDIECLRREGPVLRFPFWKYGWESGSWIYHHGLRLVSGAVHEYIAGKSLIDVGAQFGDSAIALANYTRAGVISYEIDPGTAVKCDEMLRAAGLQNAVLREKGLAEKPGRKVVAFDEEVEKYNLTVGFMKIDIEGDELGVLKVASKTLRTQHPVLSISIYHNIEVLDLPSWLEKEIGGYEIQWMNLGDTINNWCDLTMMAFPTGLDYLR
jgi:hypothetical protein